MCGGCCRRSRSCGSARARRCPWGWPRRRCSRCAPRCGGIHGRWPRSWRSSRCSWAASCWPRAGSRPGCWESFGATCGRENPRSDSPGDPRSGRAGGRRRSPVIATARPLPAARRRSGVALPAMLWVAGAAISGFTLRRYLIPLDEGILLQAATRMAGGQWPWRDFGWAYGPGEPLVMAGAFKLLGPSALWWRLLRVAADASTAVLVWVLVRDARPRWALPAWAAAALIAAQTTGPGPAPVALAFGLGAVLLAVRDRAGWAGAAAAAAAFWRPDFGVWAALAAMACAGGWRPALRVAGVAAGLGLVLYAPFAAVARPGRAWGDLVAQGGRDRAWAR